MTRSATDTQDLQKRIRQLAQEKDAVILAHNYQSGEVQDVADFTGDSLALSRLAAEAPQSTIVFAGVHFMAETAKILSPQKRVLIPDATAGCSLADCITAEQLREWKAAHPGAVVVSYVNTTAAVKAETDVCCTSANAIDVVNSIPAQTEILFCPDRNLGAHVRRVTGRKNLVTWDGACHVHAAMTPDILMQGILAAGDADVYIHPECGGTQAAVDLIEAGKLSPEKVKVLSTGGMLSEAKKAPKGSRVLVATEVGMLHPLRKANPEVTFEPVMPQAACPYMNQTTLENLVSCLESGRDEVFVDEDIAARARASVQRMIAIGKTASPQQH